MKKKKKNVEGYHDLSRHAYQKQRNRMNGHQNERKTLFCL